MEKLFILLELQRRAQEALTRQAFIHVAVNETHKLVPYAQAIFWSKVGAAVTLEKVSGNALLDDKSPYALKVKSHILAYTHSNGVMPQEVILTEENRHAIILKFQTADEGLIGGLWLEAEKPFQEADLHLLEELSVSYGYALALQTLRQKKSNAGVVLKNFARSRKYILAVFFILFFFPVRLTITAPAEIIARDADIITIPYDGMIESFHVEPGDKVIKGQVVATMENSALDAQMDNAEQALKVTESSVARLSRQSLSSPEKKSDLTAAEAEIESKRLQYQYAEDLRARSEIRASSDGIAVFADSHTLVGRPMATGERVMMIADAVQYDVLVRVPVEAMVSLSPEASLSFYLNVSPLRGYDAKIKNIGYQASPDPDGLLSYKIQAIPQDAESLRIGWKGTARVHGQWTILSYAILRRPLAAMRRMTGL